MGQQKQSESESGERHSRFFFVIKYTLTAHFYGLTSPSLPSVLLRDLYLILFLTLSLILLITLLYSRSIANNHPDCQRLHGTLHPFELQAAHCLFVRIRR